MNALRNPSPSARHLTLKTLCHPFGSKLTTGTRGTAFSFQRLLESEDSPVIFLSGPDGGYDTSRLWQGRHNSVIPLPKLAHTKGLPPSPWESVSKFHFTRCGVYAQVTCPGSIARWCSIGSAELSASQRHGVVLSTTTPVCVLVSSYIQFSRFREGPVKYPFTYRRFGGDFLGCSAKLLSIFFFAPSMLSWTLEIAAPSWFAIALTALW
mgnify:CR=1 FL=1